MTYKHWQNAWENHDMNQQVKVMQQFFSQKYHVDKFVGLHDH